MSIFIDMKITRNEIKEIIKNFLLSERLEEDSRTDSTYTLHNAKESNPVGEMGIDPNDLKHELLMQFETTAKSLIDFLKNSRIMREIAAELSSAEADGFIEGDFGTKMWHSIKSFDREARFLVHSWNELNKIQ